MPSSLRWSCVDKTSQHALPSARDSLRVRSPTRLDRSILQLVKSKAARRGTFRHYTPSSAQHYFLPVESLASIPSVWQVRESSCSPFGQKSDAAYAQCAMSPQRELLLSFVGQAGSASHHLFIFGYFAADESTSSDEVVDYSTTDDVKCHSGT